MPDKISICNMALGRLGVTRIASLDEGTTQADLCRDHYEQVVREVLEDHPWNFAEHAIALAADATPARPDFAYSYNLPQGVYELIAPRWLLDNTGYRSVCPYRITGGKLVTDLEGAWLVYTYRAPEHRWSPMFTTCIMYLLASRLAGVLTETDSKVEMEWRLYQQTLPIARNRNSQQDVPEFFELDELTGVHRG